MGDDDLWNVDTVIKRLLEGKLLNKLSMVAFEIILFLFSSTYACRLEI